MKTEITGDPAENKKAGKTGSGNENASEPVNFSYPFLGRSFHTPGELAGALAENWEEGKKQLFRGLLSSFFKNFAPDLAGICIDAEEEYACHSDRADGIYFCFLCHLDPDRKEFSWLDRSWPNLTVFGREILEKTRKKDFSQADTWDGLLLNGVLSTCCRLRNYPQQAIEALEKAEESCGESPVRSYYIIAYILSGSRTLKVKDHYFQNMDALNEFLRNLMNRSFEEFDIFCGNLIFDDNRLDPQLEAWLIVQGKEKILFRWKQKLGVRTGGKSDEGYKR